MAGFSWKTQRFEIWTIHYQPDIERFSFRPAANWRGENQAKVVAMAGDVVPEAKERLVRLLTDRGTLASGGIDWEPFEVLVDMIEDPVLETVGGVPQLVKVYKSLTTAAFVLRNESTDVWPSPAVLGRQLLEYELPNMLPSLVVGNDRIPRLPED